MVTRTPEYIDGYSASGSALWLPYPLKNRGFTATAVIALALGIGANTTIFTAVNALVLKPLQFPELDRLLMLGETNPTTDN